MGDLSCSCGLQYFTLVRHNSAVGDIRHIQYSLVVNYSTKPTISQQMSIQEFEIFLLVNRLLLVQIQHQLTSRV